MSDLKPCPFCGGNAVLDEYASGEMNITVDHEDDCWCMDYDHVLDIPSDEKDAYVRAWNTRAATLSNVDRSRWAELFGTPERAAKTISSFCAECICGDCATCGVPGWADYAHSYEELLEWLRGDA